MAIAFTLTPASPQPYQTAAVSITGLTPTTTYIKMMVYADGTSTKINFTSDGSGNATVKYVPQLHGAVTGSLRPAAECTCSTAAAATFTATH